MSIPERSAEFLLQFMLFIETALIDFGIDKEEAENTAREMCDQLRKNFGGEPIYFPMGRSLIAIMVHNAIYKAFTGNNHLELAKKFGVSKTHVYRVIKEGYLAELNDRQPDLF